MKWYKGSMLAALASLGGALAASGVTVAAGTAAVATNAIDDFMEKSNAPMVMRAVTGSAAGLANDLYGAAKESASASFASIRNGGSSGSLFAGVSGSWDGFMSSISELRGSDGVTQGLEISPVRLDVAEVGEDQTMKLSAPDFFANNFVAPSQGQGFSHA